MSQGSEPLSRPEDAIHSRVEMLENNFRDFRREIAGQFDKVAEQIASGLAGVQSKFDTLGQTREAGTGKILTILGIGVSVALTIGLGFGSYVKSTIDGALQDNRHAIERTDEALERFIDKSGNRFDRLVDQTIPKEELNARLADLKVTQGRKADKDVLAEATTMRNDQIAAIRADIEHIKSQLVSRADIDGRLDEFQNRINLLSTRLTEVAKSTDGLAIIADNLKSLRGQVDDFQRKFIAVPAFPKYNDK